MFVSLRGVKIQESPGWLKNRLEFLGLKSINNVVDVTNYVLMEFGQPLHAFDREKLSDLEISNSIKGELFKALDGSEITFTGEELTIRSQGVPQALAGVIGGEESAVSDQTKNVIIESAFFRPERVRKASRRFGMVTESSYRFSRGVDPETVVKALNRACELIREVAGGEISSDVYDQYPNPQSQKTIFISLEEIRNRLGYQVKASNFKKWMKGIGCNVSDRGSVFKVFPPSFRVDLAIPEDLIEELGRLEGYDQIPETFTPFPEEPKEFSKIFSDHISFKNFFKRAGYSEIINYSFSSAKFFESFIGKIENLSHLGLGCPQEFSLMNPISSSLSFMKPALIPDVFQVVLRNLRHSQKTGQIFEINPVFSASETNYKEFFHLALAGWGERIDLWQNSSLKDANFFQLKSHIDKWFYLMRVKDWSWKPLSFPIPFLHPGKALLLSTESEVIGFLGSLHPQMAKDYKISKEVVLCEIDLTKTESLKCAKPHFVKIPIRTHVERDLTFSVPKKLSIRKVKEEIQNILGHVCFQIEIFDIYHEGDKRSVSFRNVFTIEG